MAARHESGIHPKKKLTTYGKSTRRKVPLTLGAATTASVAEPVDGTVAVGTRRAKPNRTLLAPASLGRQQKTTTAALAHPGSSSLEPLTSGDAEDRVSPCGIRKDSAGRKRKISQMGLSNNEDKERDQLQEDEHNAPAALSLRRSPKSCLIQTRSTRRRAKEAAASIQSDSPDPMDIDQTEAKLSSPPSTPQRLRERTTRARAAANQRQPFSARTLRSLNGLSVSDAQGASVRPQQMPMRLDQPKPAQTSRPQFTSSLSAASMNHGDSKPSNSAAPASNRRRLIDALVQQAQVQDEGDSDEHTGSQVSWGDPISSQAGEKAAYDWQAPSLRRSQSDIQALSTGSPGKSSLRTTSKVRTFVRSTTGLKHTYGQAKMSMLDEDNPLDDFHLPEEPAPLKGRRLELGRNKVISSFDVEDDNSVAINSPKAKIRDIHELRQAGANDRVADEMSDLADQIGSPSSTPSSARRAALLQVADRLSEKGFRQQLRDYSTVMDAVIRHAGKETDVIGGYLIMSILLQILTSSVSLHILGQLRMEDAGSLFGRLLTVDKPIEKICRDRKNNLTKRNQELIIGGQTTLSALKIWDTAKPTSLSPRSLVLKCLQLLLTYDVDLGRDSAIFPAEVTDGLFSVLSAAQRPAFWEGCQAVEALNAQYACSVLEFHAVKAMEDHDDADSWIGRHLPLLAKVFGVTLGNAAARDSELERSIMKVVLNVTNTSPSAPGVFAEHGLVASLAGAVCSAFSQASASVAADEWKEEVYNGLVLKLGILINFVEHSPSVREAVYECNVGKDAPMNKLIGLFMENHRTTAEADSETKAHLNVAFGYLTVLLGYLSLHLPVRDLFKTSHPSKSLGPLLDSLQEFVTHHQAMEASFLDANEKDPGGEYTERLRVLVEQLREADEDD